MKNHKFCQSCGMPLSKDPNGGGTNADGTKNTSYCSYCYQNGSFTFSGTLKSFRNIAGKRWLRRGFQSLLPGYLPAG